MRRLFFISLLALIMTSCRTSKVVAHHDSTYSNTDRVEVRTRTDSVFVDRWHTVRVNGDTVRWTDSIVTTRTIRQTDTLKLTDTLYITQSDTVRTATERTTVNKAARWQIAGFWVLLVLVVVGIAWRIFKFIN